MGRHETREALLRGVDDLDGDWHGLQGGTHVLIVEAWEQNAGVAVALWTEQPLMDAKTMRFGCSRCGTSRTLKTAAI